MAFFRRVKTAFMNITPVGAAADEDLFKFPANNGVSAIIRTITNRYLERAKARTQNKAWTPYLTGRLMGSITVYPAKRTSGGTITGSMGSDLVYARRQEFEHRTKAFFILRALQAEENWMIDELNNKAVFEDLILSRRQRDTGAIEVNIND